MVDLAVAAHRHVVARGQRIDGRGADAVQAAGGLVAGPPELPAGVQAGQDELDAGHPGLGVDVDGNAAPVVVDLHRAVGVEGHLDARRVAGDALVGAVVHDLVEQVGDAAAVGRADVHARSLADGVEPFEERKVVCPVQGLGLCGQLGSLQWSWSPVLPASVDLGSDTFSAPW
ncbi:hypothetical protein GCM10020218_003960 [Dactylosporangium vinaceum]